MLDPFITLQDLTDYLGRDVTADDGAVIALDAACQICRDVAEQDFNRGTATFTLDGTGTDAILLPQLPVNGVTAVTVNGTAVTDFMLDGRGMLFRGTVGPSGCTYSHWPSGRQNVAVTADTGYDAVPTSVKMVALAVASRLVVQGVAKQETVGGVSVTYAVNATDLTAGETLILQKARPKG